MISRRNLLLLSSALALPGSPLAQAMRHTATQTPPLAAGGSSLGQTILDQQILNTADLAHWLSQIRQYQPERFNHWLSHRITQDREAGKTRWVEEWLLSETEIRLHATLHIMSHS